MNKQKLIELANSGNSINLINDIKKVCKGFHNHTHILYDIATLLDRPVTYLEIGAYDGASASLMAIHPNSVRVVSVDSGEVIAPEQVIKNVNKFKHLDCKYAYLQGYSFNKEVLQIINDKFSKIDILFIDGDHSYNGVISDYNNYKHLVTTGGVLVFDDYRDFRHSPQVKPAVDYLSQDTFIKDGFEIIGSLVYNKLQETNYTTVDSSNEYIIFKS